MATAHAAEIGNHGWAPRLKPPSEARPEPGCRLSGGRCDTSRLLVNVHPMKAWECRHTYGTQRGVTLVETGAVRNEGRAS